MGVVLQGRYKSIVFDEDRYAVQLSAYIHANPVRAGVVNNPGEYQWNSYPEYTGNRRSITGLDTEFILRQFDEDPIRARKKYESYVLKNLFMKNSLKDSYKGIAIGWRRVYRDN